MAALFKRPDASMQEGVVSLVLAHDEIGRPIVELDAIGVMDRLILPQPSSNRAFRNQYVHRPALPVVHDHRVSLGDPAVAIWGAAHRSVIRTTVSQYPPVVGIAEPARVRLLIAVESRAKHYADSSSFRSSISTNG